MAATNDASKEATHLLRVRVVRATDVPAPSDSGSLPDPYCAVLLGDQRFQTAAVDNTTAPEWNAQFEFAVSGDVEGQALVVRLWEEDTFSDDRLGGARVALTDSDLRDGEWSSKTLTVSKEGESAPCKIVVELQPMGFSGTPPPRKRTLAIKFAEAEDDKTINESVSSFTLGNQTASSPKASAPETADDDNAAVVFDIHDPTTDEVVLTLDADGNGSLGIDEAPIWGSGWG